ncbi:hypothetical protein [Herbaspirillum camelliae]|uniref:hypothetical protein n=1 Tax=Herbaspirillum camelliae TaxID=1892903 RepID=UPI001179DC59|nr:hypothetical protein [Herbaspirillum camelliae]
MLDLSTTAELRRQRDAFLAKPSCGESAAAKLDYRSTFCSAKQKLVNSSSNGDLSPYLIGGHWSQPLS